VRNRVHHASSPAAALSVMMTFSTARTYRQGPGRDPQWLGGSVGFDEL
jgi:hypothetical protein